jgi:hypothetical protein
MRIEKRFVVAAPADAVWAFLIDPRKVASCLPGASITGEIDEKTYGGAMNIKVGPVNAQYRGKLRFERLDANAREAEIVATGQETRGKGGADMRMSSRVVELGPDETEVHVTSDVQVAGVLAQLGGRMIQDVSDQMFEKFTAAMRRQLEPEPGEGAREGAAATPRPAAPPAVTPAEATPPSAGAPPEPIPSPRASAVAVPLSLTEPHEPAPSEPGASAAAEAAGAGPKKASARSAGTVATAATPSLSGGAATGANPGSAVAVAAAEAGDRQSPREPQSPPVVTPPRAPPAATEKAPAPTRPALAHPVREDVLDLGALGSTVARRATGRLLRNPLFWIVLLALLAAIGFALM